MKKLIVLFSLISLAICQQVRFCAHTIESKSLCDELNKVNDIQCIKSKDSADCTNKIRNGEADVTVLFPEQAYLASAFVNDKTSVIAEIKARQQESLPHNFQMVVVVRRDHSGGLEGLRGKKYCHPGFDGHDSWTPRLLKEFEYKLLGDKFRRSCKDRGNIAYIENEIKVLDEYFGDSCRNGPWSDDNELNEKLTKQYPKLTALCDERNKKDSISCLKVKNADLAYTTLSDALKMPDKDNYRLLCQNGSLIPIQDGRFDIGTCSWRNQPWTLVISSRDKALEIQNNLKLWVNYEYHAAPPATPFGGVGRSNRPVWTETLTKMLLQDVNQYRINVFSDQPLLLDYFKRNNQELNVYIENECPVRWCTLNAGEQYKCNWLAKASVYTGIQPQISCVQGDHIYDCLSKIRQNNADIIAINSNYGYLARKMGLTNLLYSENSAGDIASIVAVIPEQTTIKSFSDLKYKRACFPEYRGLAWVSFIDAARRHKVMKDNCKFGKSVSDFFDKICAPGAVDNYHYRQSNEVYDKLCSACSENCVSDTSNRYFNSTGVLNCLIDNIADVVFTTWQAIEKEANLQNYRILCDDEQIMTIDQYRQNWDKCSLSNTVDSEVIARYNDTRKADYRHGLLDMDIYFGTIPRNDKVFNMLNEFNGEKNLLFKENVLGLTSKHSDNKFVQNYVKLFANVDKCTNNASFVNMSAITILLSFFFVFLNRQV